MQLFTVKKTFQFVQHATRENSITETLQLLYEVQLKKKAVFELQPYKKIDLVENWFCVNIPIFLSLLFFSIFLKTVRKYLLLTSMMHQGYSLCYRKSSPKFEIEALFRLIYTETYYYYVEYKCIPTFKMDTVLDPMKFHVNIFDYRESILLQLLFSLVLGSMTYLLEQCDKHKVAIE
ncbi:hypothetical protein AGLY_008988 [Aphis glycines]|uniref:Uncharacterized protein n=1 Tax=Aphis glycines TaxID=307491 RepID=A0A6G0TJV7_APHGL|nr:hypothetical protein AGLY_008988 [Aphis glycines]